MSKARWLLELHESGRLLDLAREHATQAKGARAVGRSPDAFTTARIRLKKEGVVVPAWDELRLEAVRSGAVTPAPKGNPPRLSDGPALAAFDAEAAHEAAPDGFHVERVSTLYVDGEPRQHWVKTRRDAFDPIAAITEAFAEVRDELPRATVFPPRPLNTRDDLLAVHLVGDAHVGMHAWKDDAGENYDLDIAERNLTAAFDRLVDLSPPSSKALLINIGDYTHSDNRANTTTKGTPVDVDGRWIKVVKTSVRTRIHHIKRALEKHDEVYDIEEVGNHDVHVSLFLSLALSLYFENEPRVHIDVSPEMFHWFRFGRCLVGTHHGHMVKPSDLPGVMACDRAQDWGETLHRYWYTGHIHHERVREFPGVLWESLRSPAPSDAWHRASGYRSGHDVKLDVLHRDRGRIERHMVDIPQLVADLAA